MRYTLASGVTDWGQRGGELPTGKLNAKTDLALLTYISALVFFWFSAGCFCVFFGLFYR